MKKLIIGIALALILAVAAVPVVAANGQESLDHVVISPDPGVVIPGGHLQFFAKGQDASNHTVGGITYTWEVVGGGGTINSNGLFTAGATTGTFTDTIKVTASKGGITQTDTATVIVANHGELYEVVISPDTATILPLGTQQYSVAIKDAFGGAVALSPVWEVSGGGSIISTGLFTAGASTGTFTVKVTVTQAIPSIVKTDTATVKIAIQGVLDYVVISPDSATVLVGGTKQFNATGKDAFNQTVADVGFTWAKVSGVGDINTITGLFSAGATVGTSTIRVTAIKGGVTVTDNAVITVVAQAPGKDYRVPAGWSHGKKTGWNGGDTPPGWSKGKKTGWNDEDAPPGLLKQVNQNDEDDEDDD